MDSIIVSIILLLFMFIISYFCEDSKFLIKKFDNKSK